MHAVVSLPSVLSALKTLSPSLLLLVAIGLCGCDVPLTKKAKPATPVAKVVTPEPILRIQGDRLKVDEAMKFEDVSFLIRSGIPEQEILTAITRRGLVDIVTPVQVKLLADSGTSPKVMAAIQDPRNVLTKAERAAYSNREQERYLANRVRGFVDQQQRAVEFTERQKQIELQQKALAGAAQKEREAKDYENAKRNYETRRTYLEGEKQRLQARMNSYRKAGYSEQEIGTIARQLKKVEDEHSNLKRP